MRYLLIIFVLLGSIASAQDVTDSAASEFLVVLNQSSALQGSFKQRQYDPGGKLQTESSGLFKMLRPGYFSWEIQSPDSQLILATPQFIWHLDRDLETLTRRPVSDTGEMSPLQILGGREELLRSRYFVRKEADNSFSITPRENAAGGGSAGFNNLVIRFDNDVISGLDIIDGLKQRVLITFHDIDSHTPLSADDFAFTPPDGVDLFYYDE